MMYYLRKFLVILHCRLYALRQRVRMDALARGADVLPNGTIRMRKVTLDKSVLDSLPVRVYGQDRVPSADSRAGAAANAEAAAAAAGPSTLSRSNSHKGSISGKSIRSVRSIRSIRSAKALALAESTNDIEAAPVPVAVVSSSDEVTSDTCAVCLDEFEAGEEIRLLPCRHEFHCECIGKTALPPASPCFFDLCRRAYLY